MQTALHQEDAILSILEITRNERIPVATEKNAGRICELHFFQNTVKL